MESERFLKCYTQAFLNKGLESIKKVDFWDALFLANNYYYYQNDNYSERCIDTLNRSDLLDLIQKLNVAENNKRITPARLIAHIREEIVRRQTEIEQLKIGLDRLSKDLSRRNKEIEQLADELGRKKREIESLISERSMLYSKIVEIHASTSWKITTPIRLLSKFLSKIMSLSTQGNL